MDTLRLAEMTIEVVQTPESVFQVYNHKLRWQSLSFEALRVFVMRDDLFLLRSAD